MIAEKLLSNTQVDRLSRHLSRNHLLVLAYHGVEDAGTFREQIRWLLKIRTPVSLEMFHDHVVDGQPLPESPFLITFDDGRRSVLSCGLPVLQELDVPAALFVIAGLIGTRDPYWWDEVSELSSSGGRSDVSDLAGMDLVRFLKTVPNDLRLKALNDLRSTAPHEASEYPHLTVDELRFLDQSQVTIGSHSLTHPLMDQCSQDVIDSELTRSKSLLEDWLDRPVTALAYPNGNISDAVVTAARGSGHELGFLFDHRMESRVSVDPLRISRLRVNATTSIDHFKAIVSGVLPLIHRVRRLP